MGLTLKQCAEKAGQPESTARFYRDRFIEFFSFTGESRHREYDESTVDVLQAIARLYNEGLNHKQVKEALDGLFGVPVTNTAVSQGSSSKTAGAQFDTESVIRDVFQEELARRDEIILRMERKLDGLMDIVIERDEVITKLEQKVDEHARSAVDRDREVMETIREVQAEAQRERSMPWWRRIFGG